MNRETPKKPLKRNPSTRPVGRDSLGINQQKEFFTTAYRTGSDLWTHLKYQPMALKMLPPLEPKSLVLDVGSGRGRWAFRLVELGYRVLGIDYVEDIVQHINKEVKERGVDERARFMAGDVLDIPFSDGSFDAVTDIGLLQHLPQNDWPQYASEIERVLKSGGYVLNVSLSKETPRFLDWNPKASPTSSFEKFGMQYYFFKNEEIPNLFGDNFTVKDQQVRFLETKSDPDDNLALLFTVLQKK